MDAITLILIGITFLWTGFVRTGFGFGGAVLGLPLMLLIGKTPVYWLPIIGIHLLFFSSLALFNSSKKVDWQYLKFSLVWIVPSTVIGVIGLLSLPDNITTIFIYAITSIYAITWMLDRQISYNRLWMDKLLFIIAGYIAGTSMIGAPLIVTVYMRHVDRFSLRNTLFVLWFVIVGIKMIAFIVAGAYIDWMFALWLIPAALVGHILGNKMHHKIIKNSRLFKRWIGVLLLLVSGVGLFNYIS